MKPSTINRVDAFCNRNAKAILTGIALSIRTIVIGMVLATAGFISVFHLFGWLLLVSSLDGSFPNLGFPLEYEYSAQTFIIGSGLALLALAFWTGTQNRDFWHKTSPKLWWETEQARQAAKQT